MVLTLFSPAKINLFLRILGKRADGYHELATLMQTINFGDTLSFELSKEDQLTCSDPTLACDESNLIMKALHLFRNKTGKQFAIRIHLDKKIPTKAGLGGGSSNAATTLWALNALHNFPYAVEELQKWSASIGSDIPFFFSQGTAYCTGRGEFVRNLSAVTLPFFSLFKPSEGLSTQEVYKNLQLDRCSKLDPENLLKDFYDGKFIFVNDLEEPAFHLLPHLKQHKSAISALSGSGTAFFKLYPNNLKNWNFGCAKTPRLIDCKRHNIRNMGSFTIDQAREFLRQPKSNSSDCLGIDSLSNYKAIDRKSDRWFSC